MDISTIIGLVSGIGFMLYGIGFASIGSFIDLPSLVITLGGTFASMFISFPLKQMLVAVKAYGHIFKVNQFNETVVIKKIIELSNVARKEGLLALEEVANELDDAFLKKGILLIVDGTDPELVRSIMETELSFIESRHKGIQGFWENVASLGPAWGMIGTLIGLVKLLQSLDDPSAIGPAMSIALITTL